MSGDNHDKAASVEAQPPLVQEILKQKTWEDFFYRTPCVRSSYLWGMGCGARMVAHKLRLYKGSVNHAINAGILTFIAVSSGSFLLCAHETNQKHEMIRNAFKQKNIKEIPRNR